MQTPPHEDTLVSGSEVAELVDAAERLPFVVLVRSLERALGHEVGTCAGAARERLHLRHDPSLTFHAREITGATLDARGPHPEVTVTSAFLGLTGAASPLPTSMLEHLARGDEDAQAPHALLDVFHHRLLGLLYQGLLKHDLPRAAARGRCRPLAWALLLAGLSPESATRVSRLSDAQLMRLAPLLTAYPPNATRLAVALRSELADVLEGAAVRVVERQGAYVALAPDARARLGDGVRLGRTSALGARVRAPAAAVGVAIGPLAPAACSRLRAGGDRHALLCALIRLLVPETLDVYVSLQPTHAPALRLGDASERLGRGARLSGRAEPLPSRFTIGCAAADAEEVS